MENTQVYLKAMMSLIARQTFTPERLAEIVSPAANSRAYEAFNLCDGTRTQTEISNALKIDSGNFSRTVNKWVDEGVLIRISDDNKDKLVHVYQIPDRIISIAKKKEKGKSDE
ncbi:MarR family transcriptional regulator [Mesorhizobium sp. NPDC059025]|uniref:MarR family transcriptional regulator n=1 Tax=unclassified Mesorhizobium TaxID=325217 RepID=UPI00368D0B46